MRAPRHRVVVVGGGFGGLPACRRLAHRNVDVTLVDRRNHHLFQPLLYQVATGILSPGQVAPALRHVLRRAPNVRVVLSEVTGFDLDHHLVHTRSPLGEESDVPFDSLIVAAGSGQTYFGHDEFALYAPGMKTIDDALELRRRIFGAFEAAETATDEAERAAWLTAVVVGAGPTGVEIAGQIREIATRTLSREFRSIEPRAMHVLIVDGGSEPLATFGNHLSQVAHRQLTQLGVELRMGARVVGVGIDGVEIETASGRAHIAAHTVVWAAGVHASPLAAMLGAATGAEVDRAGRVSVLADLSLPGHPEVFAVGDMAALDDLPGVAEVAMQGGLHAANTILRRLEGEDAVAFRYRDLGSVATIGRWRAVCSVGKLRLSGIAGWFVWMFVHLGFLNGFASRATTTLSWFRSMVGRTRPERVFSVAHTGGDLSAPDAVRSIMQPLPLPALQAKEE